MRFQGSNALMRKTFSVDIRTNVGEVRPDSSLIPDSPRPLIFSYFERKDQRSFLAHKGTREAKDPKSVTSESFH